MPGVTKQIHKVKSFFYLFYICIYIYFFIMFTYRIIYKITVEEKSYIITYIKIPKTGLTTDDKTSGNST